LALHVLPDGHTHPASADGPAKLPQTAGAPPSPTGAIPHAPPRGTHAPTWAPVVTLFTGVQLVSLEQSFDVLHIGAQYDPLGSVTHDSPLQSLSDEQTVHSGGKPQSASVPQAPPSTP
jgi:hypothetical protein